MPEQRTSIIVRHRPEDLFELIADVRRYPDFIKWIKALRVSGQTQEAGRTSSTAEVVIGFKGFTERFSTRVVADAAAGTVTADLVRGPFRRLKNQWTISPHDEGARVDFYLDYEFRSFLLATLATANLDVAVRKIMDSFVSEADRRYGPT